MQRVVRSRAVRAVVLLVALGLGGVAGAPTMALPPRGVALAAGGDPDEGPDDGGGGGGPADPGPTRDPVLTLAGCG